MTTFHHSPIDMKHGSNFKNLVGMRFGRLMVLADHGRDKRMAVMWLCRCDCGNLTVVRSSSMSSGHIQSCGCYAAERYKWANVKHGATLNGVKTKEYGIWLAMRSRCRCKTNTFYKHYGGRGISICARWDKFENFLADMGRCPPGMMIERINNDGNYEPSNCRWASFQEQQNNRQDTRWISFRGVKLSMAQWAKLTGLNYKTLEHRIYGGWEIKDALTKPLNLACSFGQGNQNISREFIGRSKSGRRVFRYRLVEKQMVML